VIKSNVARVSILVTLLLSVATSASAQEKVHTVDLYSPAVERTMKYNIVLPEGYEASTAEYPVSISFTV